MWGSHRDEMMGLRGQEVAWGSNSERKDLRPVNRSHPPWLHLPPSAQNLHDENVRLQGELLRSQTDLQCSLSEALKLLTDGGSRSGAWKNLSPPVWNVSASLLRGI